MLKAYIVEDEIKAIELLKNYIEKIDFLEFVGEARNPVKAVHYLQTNVVDVLFLDINMPILSGLELYKSINNPPAVIFTTAYPEYAIEGFELEALDYLLKPIPFPRFLKACKRLLKQKETDHIFSQNEKLIFQDTVYIKSGAITHKLSWKEILYIEKDENYVIYHTPKKRILSRQTLSDLEKIFPTYICRVHKSYAVSLLHTQQIERESLKINNQVIPIGRTFKNQFMERLKNNTD